MSLPPPAAQPPPAAARARFRKALILTHEMTDSSSFDSYIARTLQPLRPLLAYGRAAAAYPQVKKKHAVWHFWKDPRAPARAPAR
jgi:hypothetical protein